MSIFTETIPSFVQNTLNNNQNIINSRSSFGDFSQKFINDVAWIRLTSGVDTYNVKTQKYDNSLAKSNRITNIIADENFAYTNLDFPLVNYSNKNSAGTYRHGIRPQPGITGLSCQSLSPNGSLRKVTVKFKCWDIKQLDVLEVLYMRPGYTMCVEWGWSQPGPSDYGDMFLNLPVPQLGETGKGGNRSLLRLYKRAYRDVKANNGNFDIAIGKVQNFSFSANTDGSWDCETTIVTYGEILESLKINYIPFESNIALEGISELNKYIDYALIVASGSSITNKYSEGILPGILQQLSFVGSSIKMDDMIVNIDSTTPVKGKQKTRNQIITLGEMTGRDSAFQGYGYYNGDPTEWKAPSSEFINLNDRIEVWAMDFDDLQIINHQPIRLDTTMPGRFTFISLNDFCNILNKYVIVSNGLNTKSDEGEFVSVTTRPNRLGTEYENTQNASPTNPNIFDTYRDQLMCVANPFSISVNPTVCILRPDGWMERRISSPAATNPVPPPLNHKTLSKEINDYLKSRTTLNLLLAAESFMNDGTIQEFENALQRIVDDIGTQIDDQNNGITITNLGVADIHFIPNYSDADFVINNASPYGPNLIGWNFVERSDGRAIANKDIQDVDDSIRNGIADPSSALAKIWKITRRNPNDTSTSSPADNVKLTNLVNLCDRTYKWNTNPYVIYKENEFNQNYIALKSRLASNSLDQTFEYVPSFFADIDTFSSGYHGNILLNIDFLYSLVKPKNENSNDNEHNDIFLAQYLKSILTAIQNCTGNINNFQLYGDYTDNTVRIVDLNYVTPPKTEIFNFEVDNTQSIVKNYGIKSQIFPEQSSIVAISSQTRSGRLGYKNETLVAYNEGIVDRILGDDFNSGAEKKYPTTTKINQANTNNSLFLAIFELTRYSSIFNPNVNWNGSLYDVVYNQDTAPVASFSTTPSQPIIAAPEE